MFDNEKPAWKRFIYRVLGACLILAPFALFFFDAIDLFQMFLGVLGGASIHSLLEYFVEDHFARRKRERDEELEVCSWCGHRVPKGGE